MKKVSVIIPCYNKGKYVKDSIESVINQTYKNIEIVCVDDCSKDNSQEIIRELADTYKNILVFYLNENKGVINARNMAIDASSGEYILPLDADDTIEPTYVEKAVKVLDNNPRIGLVYSRAKFLGKCEEEWKLPKFNLEAFLYNNCIFNSAMFRKSDFYRAGKYKENMKNGCEDWDLWLSIIELNLHPYRIDEILFNYRQVEHSRSSLVAKNTDWKKSLLKNHLDFYLENSNFVDKIFSSSNKSYSKHPFKKCRNFFAKSIVSIRIPIFTFFKLC